MFSLRRVSDRRRELLPTMRPAHRRSVDVTQRGCRTWIWALSSGHRLPQPHQGPSSVNRRQSYLRGRCRCTAVVRFRSQQPRRCCGRSHRSRIEVESQVTEAQRLRRPRVLTELPPTRRAIFQPSSRRPPWKPRYLPRSATSTWLFTSRLCGRPTGGVEEADITPAIACSAFDANLRTTLALRCESAPGWSPSR